MFLPILEMGGGVPSEPLGRGVGESCRRNMNEEVLRRTVELPTMDTALEIERKNVAETLFSTADGAPTETKVLTNEGGVTMETGGLPPRPQGIKEMNGMTGGII